MTDGGSSGNLPILVPNRRNNMRTGFNAACRTQQRRETTYKLTKFRVSNGQLTPRQVRGPALNGKKDELTRWCGQS